MAAAWRAGLAPMEDVRRALAAMLRTVTDHRPTPGRIDPMTDTTTESGVHTHAATLDPAPFNADGTLDYAALMAAWRVHLAEGGCAPSGWPTRVSVPAVAPDWTNTVLHVEGPAAPMDSAAAHRFDARADAEPDRAYQVIPPAPDPLLDDYDPTPGLVARGVMADPEEEPEPEPVTLPDHEAAVARFAACHTPEVQALARWFGYGHLREGMPRDTSAACAALAAALLATLPAGEPETEAALRHLLEAKDAAVRAAIAPTLTPKETHP